MRTLTSLALLAGLAGCANNPEDTDDTTVTDDGPVACDDNVCVLSGIITEDLTLTADKAWLLRGGVFIGDDANATVLTIEPGTTVYGESSTDGMLVVTRHSQILAEGTADAPIVFTSSKEVGTRARGDWGGLIINGLAGVNACGEATEVACESYGEGGTGWYGGDDDDDDSGVLSYVRIEFAGTLVSPDNELNGLALQAVGRGTQLDHIQVHMNADDGVEFFGGTAEIRHLLVTGVGDDSLDWTDGWRGKGQFIVLEHYEDAGDNGIEADNNGEANDATPRSKPMLSNVTVLGAEGGSSSDVGVLLREGTAGVLSNMLVQGYNDACIDIDHAATFANAWNGTALSGELTVDHSLFDCSAVTAADDDDGTEFTMAEFVDTLNPANTEGDGSLSSGDYVPTSTDATTGGKAATDDFFVAATYRGGVDPAADWTVGWTVTERN